MGLFTQVQTRHLGTHMALRVPAGAREPGQGLPMPERTWHNPFGRRGQARCRWASPDGSLRLGKDVAPSVYFGGMVREFQVICDYLGFVGEEAVPPSRGVPQTDAALPALLSLPCSPCRPCPALPALPALTA